MNPLKRQGIGIIIGLTVQYLLGMATNLFVQFPETANEQQLWEFAKKQLLLVAHIIIGFLLLIGGVVLLVRAVKHHDRNWIIAGSVGLIAIIAAILAGASFIPSQKDPFSYLMATSFMVALLAYGWGVVRSK